MAKRSFAPRRARDGKAGHDLSKAASIIRFPPPDLLDKIARNESASAAAVALVCKPPVSIEHARRTPPTEPEPEADKILGRVD